MNNIGIENGICSNSSIDQSKLSMSQ